MARIDLITTGGTIASLRNALLDETVAALPADRLRELLPVRNLGAEVHIDAMMSVNSCAMSLQQSFAVAMRIQAHLADTDCIGVVVTHGTDTMEESAYLADLLVTSDKPVVFTGAQRSADAPDADGPANLADALTLAASPLGRGIGVVVVFDGQIHAARDVTKFHTSRLGTFVSLSHGKLGEIDAGEVHVSRRPMSRPGLRAARIEDRVDLLTMTLGADDRLLRYAAASGAKAVVLQAFGRGNANPAVASAVADIVAAGVPVIVTSRCPDGFVRPIYGNGGGKDLQKAGAIFAGDLAGAKARILAAVLLGDDRSMAEIRAVFGTLGG